MQLYDALFAISGSPVASVNRALAIAELHGAQRALEDLNAIGSDPRLSEYQPYWAARAELLARIHARQEAHHAYSIAIGLERDPAVRRFLENRKRMVEE